MLRIGKVVSVTVAACVAVVYYNNLHKKRELPERSLSKEEEYSDLEEITIKKCEYFSGCCAEKDSVLFWKDKDVSRWTIKDGGYLLLDKRVILPHSSEGFKIIKAGESYRWIPCDSEDVIVLTNILELTK